MATYFAQLDDDNVVTNVIVVADEDAPDEAAGIAFCQSLLGQDTKWVQTSYTHSIRKRYAGIGHTYDATKDKFISPRPFPSWRLDTADDWEPPVALPADEGLDRKLGIVVKYNWNETLRQWDRGTHPLPIQEEA